MKKNLSRILAAAMIGCIMILNFGCDMMDNNKNPTHSHSPNETDKIITDGESLIENFVEGEEIDEKDLPEKILNAIKNEGENLLISAVSYATYVGKQTYRVILSETGMGNTREIYVTANGEVIPTDTKPSADSTDAAKSASPSAAPQASQTADMGK